MIVSCHDKNKFHKYYMKCKINASKNIFLMIKKLTVLASQLKNMHVGSFFILPLLSFPLSYILFQTQVLFLQCSWKMPVWFSELGQKWISWRLLKG